jgi:protein ImuB
MPFACIFVPDFPVAALLRAEPELRLQAVAVLDGKAPWQRVFACNEKARALGVEIGMTKLQLETCNHLALRSRTLGQENTAHAALLDCAQSFSPRVEDADWDTILLDLDGLQSLFGASAKLARDMARCAFDFGLETHIAVASNPETAVLAARGFSGVTVIPPGKEAEQLGNLPFYLLLTDTFGFSSAESREISQTLDRWGIRHLRELSALPDAAVSQRMGQRGIRLQQLARGATSRTLVPVEPPMIFEETVELEHPVVLLEPLAFLLRKLLRQLCNRLSARALSTQELHLRLRLETDSRWETRTEAEDRSREASPRNPWFERSLRLPVPVLDIEVFLKLLQLDLKANPPGAPILQLRLRAQPVKPRAVQGEFFLPPSPQSEKLELTLAKIAGIVGGKKVGAVALVDTYRREGFYLQRFSPREARPENGETSNQLVTALRVFRPALPVTVTLRNGSPTRIAAAAKGKGKQLRGAVVWAAGPWRSSGDWWEQQGWAHDEWDVAVQQEPGIALYRLVHDLLSGRWLIEGTYD